MIKFSERKRKYYALLYIIPFLIYYLIAFVLYKNSLYAGYKLDDFLFNHYLMGTSLSERFCGFFSGFWSLTIGLKNMFGFYRPIYFAWVTVNYSLFGLDSFYWHVVQLTVHVSDIWLFYLLIMKLSRLYPEKPDSFRLGFLSGIIMSFFCGSYEAVSWLVLQEPILMLSFIFSLIKYIDYRRSGRFSSLAASLIFYIIAIFTKETASFLFFVFPLMELIIRRSRKIKKIPNLKKIFIFSIFCVFIIVYFAIRKIIAGSMSTSYDLTWMMIYVEENLYIYADEFLLFPAKTIINGFNADSLRCSMVYITIFIFVIRSVKSFSLMRMRLIILGLIWGILVIAPTFPFKFASWRMYPAGFGISLIIAAMLCPDRKNNNRFLSVLNIIVITTMIILSSQIINIRVDKYMKDREKLRSFYDQLKMYIQEMPDNQIIYIIDYYEFLPILWHQCHLETFYGKKLNVEMFDYTSPNHIKPADLYRTRFFKWREKTQTLNEVHSPRTDVVKYFKKFKYHPLSSWEFNNYETEAPEPKKTGCFEFSLEKTKEAKGMVLQFIPGGFFDTAKNTVKVRLSAIPSGSDSKIEFFYLYSIEPVKWNTWHFVPLEINPMGDFREYTIEIKPYDKFEDMYWWGGILARMGLKFEGGFEYVKIDYIRTLKE